MTFLHCQGLPGFDAALRECADQDASVQEMKEMERQKVCVCVCLPLLSNQSFYRLIASYWMGG